MPHSNRVDSVADDLYLGEDQLIEQPVDASNDDSDIDPADWLVEARFSNSRVPLGTAIVEPVHIIGLAYFPPEPPSTIISYRGLLLRGDGLSKLKIGPVTMEIWRTNSQAVKMLQRVDFTVYATIKPTTTTSTTTTSTTTT